MTLSPTFERRFRRALELERQGLLEAALDALGHVFDPLEESTERRVASAEFCMKVELRRASLLDRAGHRQAALELIEADWTWRLANSVDPPMRRTFLNAYAELKAVAGAPWRVEPEAVLRKLQGALFGPHRLSGWDALLRGDAHRPAPGGPIV